MDYIRKTIQLMLLQIIKELTSRISQTKIGNFYFLLEYLTIKKNFRHQVWLGKFY